MSKSRDTRKEEKKKPVLSPAEKKKAKQAIKKGKQPLRIQPSEVIESSD